MSEKTPLPDPPLPSEVDLRDFQYMELDVQRLRDSRFAAEVDGEAFRAGLLLWCASWHQVPAASLPDNDIELSQLAGFGRVVKEWRKVREQALSLFVRCSDGRLYHPVIAEKALSAWQAKLRHHFDRARDRLRKLNKQRATGGLQEIAEITFEQWNAQRMAAGIPMEKADASAGIPQPTIKDSAGIPPENALKGNGEGTERERNGEGTETLYSSAPPPGGADAVAPRDPPTPTPKPSKPRAAKAKEPPPTAETWTGYADAYAIRYGTEPVRNAKVNAQLSQLVARLGADEAPGVARFFVGHQNALYVRAMHPVDLLLRDAERLRTEWVTNTQTTNAGAIAADRTQTNLNAFGPLLAEARAKEAAHGDH